jgi:hypothetical protein
MTILQTGVDVETDITVVCSEHQVVLDAEYEDRKYSYSTHMVRTLHVSPCSKCIEEAQEAEEEKTA